ncbi:stealth conserved region 3 domain-containing protein [Streptomyces sp. G44]|uniref:stealth family protein n=1 Tax=Streptomyces sp. G44 TaxID=2807632 RepID=UPI001960AA02|nr:stealth family protein [Streptomyces sp. G44]MBM7167323.1 stealth conserved region 3 domain-containing protein [Streptomyces sp. G44]
MPLRTKKLTARLLPARVRAERARQREEQAGAAKAAEAAAAEQRRREKIAARRLALLASDPEVREIRFEGHTYYGRTVGHFTATGASARNLGLVADALGSAGVDYFLVPGRSHTRHVIGMRLADRKRLLDELRAMYGATALYAVKPGTAPLPSGAVLYADGSLPTALKRQDVIRFGEILLDPSGRILADLSYGCDVEFWQDGGQLLDDERAAPHVDALRTQAPPAVLVDSLVAPRPNAVTDTLPLQAQIAVRRPVGDRDHPTYEAFAHPRVDAVDFPVDLVYTWVDGADPALRARRDSCRGVAHTARIHERETGASRYTSRDELKYSLRSVEMYAPFVRNIYLVTDGQVPAWLDTSVPGLQVVDHKEIFTDPSVLPVFNSHAIETQLHHIAGLAEHYLYLNDDFFFVGPVTAGNFFHGNGIAKLPFSSFQLGLGTPHPDEPAPNSAGKNVRRLLLDAHDRLTVSKFKHAPQPQLRSVMAELEEAFEEDVARTSRSRFRSVEDIAMTTALHHHHAYLTGRAVPGKYRQRYIDIGKTDVREALTEFGPGHKYDFLCLNDVNTPAADQERVTAEVRAFLATCFPFAGRWERAEEQP